MASEIINYVIDLWARYIHSLIVQFSSHMLAFLSRFLVWADRRIPKTRRVFS